MKLYSMKEQSLRDINEECFFCEILYGYIVNNISYRFKRDNGEKMGAYKDNINEILQHTSIDIQVFNNLLDEYIDHYSEQEDKDVPLEQLFRRAEERIRTPLENYILDYKGELNEKLKNIPNSLDKAKNLLLGLISAYIPKYYSDQVYDAIVLLKEVITPEKIKNIINDWEKEARHHFRYGDIDYFKIFWISDVEYEQIDAISRYRLKTQFNIRGFEFAFEEVESQLEDIILDTRGSSLGSHDLWLISRSQELSDKLAGIDLKLKGYIKTQYEDGYWRNENKLDITTPDINTTAIIVLNLLKLSPSRQWRQSGVKGARWIQTRQNLNGSWSSQFMRNREIILKSDIFTTILCLEALRRIGLDDTEEIIKKGENWIMNQQTSNGAWEDEYLPFPFLTVLVLEYFYNKDLYSHQLPLFLDDLTPASIILLGMKKAIEISKKCKSEENRISPKVGTIVIKDDQIILEAYRGETSPGDHAEYIALQKKGKDLDLKDSILITTLEPCTTRSLTKTPCAQRIVDAGIKEICVGMLDPNPQIRGRGILYLTKQGVSIRYFPPEFSNEVREINKEFWDDQIKNYYKDITNSQINIMAMDDGEHI